jgi:hypothetical protein
MLSLIFGGITSIIGPLLTPIFGFLTSFFNNKAQVSISANTTAGAVITNADSVNAQIRMKEGAWSPWVIDTIVLFMWPFGWHTWQVVLDSSHWVPALGWLWYIPYPTVETHVIGSWHVATLPGMFQTTEHAIINSLFIGAAAVLALSGFMKR